MNFKDFPLKESLLRSIEDRGYTVPTDIQAEAIPLLCGDSTDFVGQAQTGTGKTAAFALPLLNNISPDERDIQAIILSPTRELANQICEEMKKFSVHERMKVMSVYGGVPIDGQIRDLKRLRPQIIVGTPGRVLDLIRRRALKLENAKFAVLDEADEMLDMGFLDDVKSILSELGEHKTWMFSATMPPAILGLIRSYLKDPKVVKIKKKTLSNENITQKYYVVRDRSMREAVCRLLDSVEEYYGIIFTKTKMEAKSLTDELNARGFLTDSLHGDMDQKHRDHTMRKFKEKKVKLLVCTDVAARGIDVDHLTHVFNFGLPQDLESYVHRIGRTGRAGQKGMALSIVNPSEVRRIRALENLTKAKIEKDSIPSAELLKSAMIRRSVNQFGDIITDMKEKEDKVDETFALFNEGFADLDKEQVLKVMFKFIFAENMKRLDREPNLDAVSRQREAGSGSSRGPVGKGVPDSSGNIRFFVSGGREDGLTLDGLLSDIAKGLKIDQNSIRNVQLKDKFSFLDIPADLQSKLVGEIEVFAGSKKLRFEPTERKERTDRGGYRGNRGGAGGGYRGNRDGGGGGGYRGNRDSGGGGYRGSRDGGSGGHRGTRDAGSRDSGSRDGSAYRSSSRDGGGYRGRDGNRESSSRDGGAANGSTRNYNS